MEATRRPHRKDISLVYDRLQGCWSVVNASTLERKPLPRHTHHIGSNDEYIIYWDEDGDGFIGYDSWQCDLDEFMDLAAFEDQQGTTFVQ